MGDRRRFVSAGNEIDAETGMFKVPNAGQGHIARCHLAGLRLFFACRQNRDRLRRRGTGCSAGARSRHRGVCMGPGRPVHVVILVRTVMVRLEIVGMVRDFAVVVAVLVVVVGVDPVGKMETA